MVDSFNPQTPAGYVKVLCNRAEDWTETVWWLSSQPWRWASDRCARALQRNHEAFALKRSQGELAAITVFGRMTTHGF